MLWSYEILDATRNTDQPKPAVDVGEVKEVRDKVRNSSDVATEAVLSGDNSATTLTIIAGDWLGNAGQAALIKLQTAGPNQCRTGIIVAPLSSLIYAEGSLMPISPNDGWHEIESTADSGACYIVMLTKECEWINIHESIQSKGERK